MSISRSRWAYASSVRAEIPGNAQLILAEIVLGSAGSFAALDDLLVMTMWVSYGELCRHGPLLRAGSGRDRIETRPSVTSISVCLHDSNTTTVCATGRLWHSSPMGVNVLTYLRTVYSFVKVKRDGEVV